MIDATYLTDRYRSRRPTEFGWSLIIFVGIMLIGAGLMGIIGAFYFQLYPYEIRYFQIPLTELNNQHNGRILSFILHNRIAYHGVLMSYGILYTWLAFHQRATENNDLWIWWALLISGSVGASSTFISYLLSDYLDVWYTSASIILIGIFYIGLILSYDGSRCELSTLIKPYRSIGVWNYAGIGHRFLLLWSVMTVTGGLLVFYTGMSSVFVPEDLIYIGANVESLNEISPTVIPFVAHNRIGFGITLLAFGLAAISIVWQGIHQQNQSALVALICAYMIHHLTAIWIHPLVGYNSISHLLPFLIKDGAFILGIFYLYRSPKYAPFGYKHWI